jgi:hypothetical protein
MAKSQYYADSPHFFPSSLMLPVRSDVAGTGGLTRVPAGAPAASRTSFPITITPSVG